EILADDTDDWMEAISEDDNFNDVDPTNWMEDVDLESHDHTGEYDEFEKDDQSEADDLTPGAGPNETNDGGQT
ncbi:hypothetical protein N9N97_00005, partial [Rickettsiaceae bacterium]|nr:hypothetical protein [Rickettsiaceae bacterium]